MPFLHHAREFVPLCVISEKKSHKNGLRHSIFTSRYDRYVGDWKQQDNNTDKKHGKGYFLTFKGRLYEGDWLCGYRHGFGLLSKRNERGFFNLEYRGEWIRGKPDGAGWWWFDNGDVYFGFWKKGYQQGYGKMWYKDGTYYVGYWNKNKREGIGMFVQLNGNRYEGHWEDNIKSGIGRFYHLHTGQLQEGCWVNNICVKSKMSDIIIRQFGDLPTQYPIPEQTLQDAVRLLEKSKLWLSLRVGEIDSKLRNCIDQMWD